MKTISKNIAIIAIFASLYATASLLTAYIPTGIFFIQFRPAIAIPMVAAVIYSPLTAGLSAAIGTFIASIIRYGTPLLTIFSGTPANFLGFYTMSLTYRVLRRNRVNWILALILSSIAGLIVGSVIIGLGLWFIAVHVAPGLLPKGFANIGFALTSSFILVFAPAPIALFITALVIDVLKKSGKISNI